MSELPKCRLCSKSPVLVHGRSVVHLDSGCPLSGAHSMSAEQWTALMGRGEPVGAYDAEALAYELCLEECSEEDATRLLWEGHPPEPWGEVWQRYIPDAERMIERVKKHMTAQAPAVDDTERLNWLIRKLSGKALREIGVIYSAGSESFIRAAIDSAIKGEG